MLDVGTHQSQAWNDAHKPAKEEVSDKGNPFLLTGVVHSLQLLEADQASQQAAHHQKRVHALRSSGDCPTVHPENIRRHLHTHPTVISATVQIPNRRHEGTRCRLTDIDAKHVIVKVKGSELRSSFLQK